MNGPVGDYSGQIVVVTGASSGIGAGLAARFARLGATVAICARREDRLARTLEECRLHAPASQMFPCDLADADATDQLARDVLDTFGAVDVLVNNAGIPKRRHVTALDIATVEAVMRINYLAPARLTLALLPAMLDRGRGRLVYVSSVAATLSSPGEAAYDASKAALGVFAEAAAIDLWDRGIKVSVVYPGVVDTELFTLPDNDEMTAPVERISVDELVDAVFEGIARDEIAIYVPSYFAEIAAQKAANTGGFIEGAAQYVRTLRSES